MKTEKLGNLCDILIGRTPSRKKPEYWGKGFKWASISDLSTKYVTKTKEEITKTAIKEIRCRLIPKGTLLFSFKLTIGKVSFAGSDTYTNEAIAGLIIKNCEILSNEYLYFALKSMQFEGSNQAVKGKTLNSNSLANIKIPLPPLHEQKRIATLLSKVEAMINQRKNDIEQLDNLLKSSFLQLFGDPVRNEKNWLTFRLDEISDSRLGKMRDKNQITGSCLKPYLANFNVQWFQINTENLNEMDFDAREQKKYSLQSGDLLVCEGGEIGRCAIWKKQVKDCYFQKALHRVRFCSKVKPEFMQYVFYFYAKHNGFKNVTSKATISHLTGEKLKATLVPVPPIQLQEKFSIHYNMLEQLKTAYASSQADLRSLYSTLTHQAFTGQLNFAKASAIKNCIESSNI